MLIWTLYQESKKPADWSKGNDGKYLFKSCTAVYKYGFSVFLVKSKVKEPLTVLRSARKYIKDHEIGGMIMSDVKWIKKKKKNQKRIEIYIRPILKNFGAYTRENQKKQKPIKPIVQG